MLRAANPIMEITCGISLAAHRDHERLPAKLTVALADRFHDVVAQMRLSVEGFAAVGRDRRTIDDLEAITR